MYRRQRSNGSSNSQFKPPRMTSPPLRVPNENETNGVEATDLPKKASTVPKQVPPVIRKTVQGPKQSNIKKPRIDTNEPAHKTTLESKDVRYFEVVWRKYTTKKNKTWDGDGFIILTSSYISFRLDESDHFKERLRINNVSKFTTDGTFSLGSFEIESMGEILDIDSIAKITGSGKPTNEEQKQEAKVTPPIQRALAVKRESSLNINRQFKKVLPSSTGVNNPKNGEPLHDPFAADAIVMNKATSDDVDVVIDPFIAKNLRPHQVKGVRFLYDCVMGLKDFDGNGALLADDMGLGKTLQTISLIWTLIKQSPSGAESPIASKVLIACPVTLVANWKREFKKWLPMNRLGVLTLNSKNTVSKDKQDLSNFARTKVYQVLIMGYEKILNMKDELALSNFDLLVCDEGHRLKNNSNKTLNCLKSLDIEKKVLLSGTPIQNDLTEFFNIIDFINPGVLGNFNSFKRNFMNPISRARELNCMNPEITQLGDERSKELIDLTKPFILRRTSSILSHHLPPKSDVVLFCRPTAIQHSTFNEVLGSHKFENLIKSANSASGSLGLITMFKKICNSPSLVKSDKVFKDLTDGSNTNQTTASGKLSVFIELIKNISRNEEKVVIVSNYTQTLDILESTLNQMNLTHLRLDGSIPNKDRDSIVNRFNNGHPRAAFAFLLSAKSGGVGLNLIGASRLILFDNDWNPSVDLQAMARIHRDGQKKPVFIYRLITTGCIDEKIFQRQLMKSNLSDKFLDNKTDFVDDLFDLRDLRDLFTVHSSTNCQTHDLIECDCDTMGEEISIESDTESDDENDKKSTDGALNKGWVSALAYKENSIDENLEKKNTMKKCLMDYRHFDPSKLKNTPYIDMGDSLTEKVIASNEKLISFVLTKVNRPTL